MNCAVAAYAAVAGVSEVEATRALRSALRPGGAEPGRLARALDRRGWRWEPGTSAARFLDAHPDATAIMIWVTHAEPVIGGRVAVVRGLDYLGAWWPPAAG